MSLLDPVLSCAYAHNFDLAIVAVKTSGAFALSTAIATRSKKLRAASR